MTLTQYDWYSLAVIVSLTVVSFISRSVYLLLGDRLPLPDSVRLALRYAPVAALTAIIIPEIFPWSAQAAPTVHVSKLIAAVVAVGVYFATRNTIFLMLSGIATYALSQLIF